MTDETFTVHALEILFLHVSKFEVVGGEFDRDAQHILTLHFGYTLPEIAAVALH